MADVRLTPRARQDLGDIWMRIAADNEPAADRLLDRFFDQFERAASFPEMGSARPDIAPTARLLVEGSYVILYELVPEGVLIVAIVHGMRDPARWLE